MRLMDPAGRAMIAGAVAHARAAGVPEETIQGMIEQERVGRGGGIVPAALAGRLHALAKQYEGRRATPGD